MPGAKIVLNSRFFHIARAGEKADGKHAMTRDAAMGLVNYVGTRESVELNVNQTSMNGEEITALNLDPLKVSAEVAALPATSKQMKTIADLLWEIPEAKKGLEYQDFKANPTIENASELISYAAEIGLGFAVDLGKAKNLIEYVGKRPGVDRVGEHGLFSSEPNVDIRKAQEEIASCKGKIWTHVISLRREDADALGYDHQKPWRDLVLQKIDVIAEASNIPISKLHWYAGMHNTTHHPHIHLFVFTDDPKVGHLNVSGINKMKATFSEVIFADERRHIYEHKTEIRDSLKQKIDNILSDVQNGSADQLNRKQMDSLSEKLLHLGEQLKDRPGKLQYGWIKDLGIRREVNAIMSGLADAPAIRQLYELYCEDHKDLQRMYRNDPKDIGPIIENREFDSIKNKIIRAAVAISKNAPELDGTLITITDPNDLQVTGENRQSSMTGTGDPLSDEESLFLSAPDERLDWMPPQDEENPFEPDSASATRISDTGNDRDWDRKKPSDRTKDSFEECFDKAMNGDIEAKYQLARRYFYGNDVERDYDQAQMWYGLAAAAGHSFAKYELGKMYLYGIGIEKNQELGTEYCLDAYWNFRASVEKSYGFDVGRSVDDGTAEKEGFTGIKAAAYLMYTLGRMEYAGEGMPRDYSKAYQWFRLSADGGHVHSNYRLAKMYYAGEGIRQDYAMAESYFRTAADGKDKYAYYALGKMFDTGIGAEQNYKKAADWYTKASMENVSYADYRLAKMYSNGQGVEKDDELADALYQKALNEFIEQDKQQPDADTEFRVANMYLKGLGVEKNPEEGLKWLGLCCEKKNARAQYQLAGMYQKGEGVPQDEIKAQSLYSEALTGFLEQEKETPAAYVEYQIAGMYKYGNGTEQDDEIAFQWYVEAAEKGHPHAAYYTARACYEGTGTEQSYSDAVKWYQKAANGGDAYAMYALGKMYRDGMGMELNSEQAYQYFLAAAKLEHEFAQFAAAEALLSGTGVKKNVQGAVDWFQKCAEKGNLFAFYQLGRIYSEEDMLDEKKARLYYALALAGFIEQEKEEENAQTEYCIASMLLDGLGTEKDVESAVKWFSKSAKQNNPYAAYKLGEIFSDENQPCYDQKKASRFYRQAFDGFLNQEQEEADARLEYRVASMYLEGKGTEKDVKAAVQWFTLSAEKENNYAAYQLGEIFSDEKQPCRDMEKANNFYRQALNGFLEQEEEEADTQLEYRIANMYLAGKGAKKDVEAAVRWFSKSAEKNNSYAAYRLGEIFSDEKQPGRDQEKASRFYRQALDGFLKQEQDEADPQLEYRIAGMYSAGKGVEKDVAAAVRWFSKSADRNNFYSAYQLGELLSDKELPKDTEELKGLYSSLSGLSEENRKAIASMDKYHLINALRFCSNTYYTKALTGYIESEAKDPDDKIEYKIAQMYHSGKGTIKNDPKAFQWFSLSASKGNAYAQFQVARMLEKGEGIATNKRQAQMIYASALAGFLKILQEKPDADLLYKVGMMYESGLGTKRDLSTAKQYYAEAAAEGNIHAQLRLNQIQAYHNQAAVSAVMGLFSAFAYSLGDNIKDSTTRKYRHDRKLVQKQKVLKEVHGHQYDDQEEIM